MVHFVLATNDVNGVKCIYINSIDKYYFMGVLVLSQVYLFT